MINPNRTVRIKYIHDETVKNRVSRGVVPRKGEAVELYDTDETGVPINEQQYVVKNVAWRVSRMAGENVDVANVYLETLEEREARLEDYMTDKVDQ